MSKHIRVSVAKGLTVTRGSDGHWIAVEFEGKYGMFNVENTLRNITRAAFVNWIDDICDKPAPVNSGDDGEGE